MQHGLHTGILLIRHHSRKLLFNYCCTGNQLIAYPPEHLNTFFEEHGVVADYIDPNFVYGFFDEGTGTWSGMMEHVRQFGMSQFAK